MISTIDNEIKERKKQQKQKTKQHRFEEMGNLCIFITIFVKKGGHVQTWEMLNQHPPHESTID